MRFFRFSEIWEIRESINLKFSEISESINLKIFRDLDSLPSLRALG